MKRIFALLLLLSLLLSGCTLQAPTITTAPPASTEATAPAQPEGTLEVHFINVGQADCALLECGGEFMIIDGGNAADSSLVVSYLLSEGVEELKAVVATHPHEDHVGGLPAVLAVFPTKAAYGSTKSYYSGRYDDYMRYVDQQGLELIIPEPGDSWTLGGATVTVLGPLKSYTDFNDTSIVLMVEFGRNRFLFTGDMEAIAEKDLIESGADLKADVLKVGHHGSHSSTTYRFLYEVSPTYAVIPVGKDNEYGHPHEEPISRLDQAGVVIYRTDRMGSIVATSDGKKIDFSWEVSSAGPQMPSPGELYYIGNSKSKVLHLPNCGNQPAEHNQVIFTNYEDALSEGYKHCSQCME